MTFNLGNPMQQYTNYMKLRKLHFKWSKHLPEFYKEWLLEFHKATNNDGKHIVCSTDHSK